MAFPAGLRVVRGPDWEWGQQDGGSGLAGTVLGGTEGRGVVVQWDSGLRGKYRCGLRGKYDLRVLDSGPSGLYFSGVRCFGCRTEGIRGYQWKCLVCPDYQLCGTCYMSDYHSLRHKFKCITNRKGHGYKVMSRYRLKRRFVHGLFPGATVARGDDWRWKNQDGGPGNTGQLLKVTDWKSQSYRSIVEVDWQSSSSKNLYRVGHRGKVDLKSVSPGQGPLHYLEHLPVLGCQFYKPGDKEMLPGDKVKCEPDIEALRLRVGEGELQELVSMMLDGTGVVIREVLPSGAFSVRFANNSVHVMMVDMMTRVHSHPFKEGDVVRMLDDISEVYKLQQGHGEWTDNMALNLGQVGVVRKLKPSGTVLVQFEDFEWVLNPACIDPAPDATPPDMKYTGDLFLNTLIDMGMTGLGLLHAIKTEDENKIRFYLGAHPDKLNEVTQDHTPLEMAIDEGRNKAVRILVQEYKPDLERVAESSRRPIHICAHADNVEAARLLLGAGVDVNAPTSGGRTALMVASMLGAVKTLRVLAAHPSVNLNAKDSNGSTALRHSIRSHRSLSTAILLDHEATPSIDCFHDAAFIDNLPAMEELARRSSEMLNRRSLGANRTLLHVAGLRNSYSVVEFLCRHKSCDTNCVDGRGRTVLHYAAFEGHSDMVELVVGYGVNVNQDDLLGTNALHHVLSKKTCSPPHEFLSPHLIKVKSKLKHMLGTESVVPDYMVVACFLAQEKTSIVRTSTEYGGKAPVELCPPEYRDVLHNFVNKPGNFSGSFRRRGGQVGQVAADSEESIHSFKHRRHTSKIRQRDRAALRKNSASDAVPLPQVVTPSKMVSMATPKNTLQVIPPTHNITSPTSDISAKQTTPPVLQTTTLLGSTPTDAISTSNDTLPNTSIQVGSTFISTSTSVSGSNTLVSNGNTTVSNGNTTNFNSSVSNGNTHTSVSSICVPNSVSTGNLSPHNYPSTQHHESITSHPVTATSTTTSITAPLSSIVNEVNSTSSVLKDANTLASKPLGVKSAISVSVKNLDPMSTVKYPDMDTKKNKSLVVTKDYSGVSQQGEAPDYHYSNTGNLTASLQQQLQPSILEIEQITSTSSGTNAGSPVLCIVCEDVCDVQFVPCGHVLVCSKCGHRIKRCPGCKVVVQGKIAVNWNS